MDRAFAILSAIVAVALAAVWFQSAHSGRVIANVGGVFGGAINAAQRI